MSRKNTSKKLAESRTTASRVAEERAAFAGEVPELGDDFFSRSRVRAGSKIVREGEPARKKGRPPQGESAKVQQSLRLSPEVLEAIRGGGPGWQTRIDHYLAAAGQVSEAIEAAGGIERLAEAQQMMREAVEAQHKAIRDAGGVQALTKMQRLAHETIEAQRKSIEKAGGARAFAETQQMMLEAMEAQRKSIEEAGGAQAFMEIHRMMREAMDANSRALQEAGGMKAIADLLEQQRQAIEAIGGIDRLVELGRATQASHEAFLKQARAAQALLGRG